MKKLYISATIFFLTLSLCFPQTFLPKGTYRSPFEKGVKGNSGTNKIGKKTGQYLLLPTVGYGNYANMDVGNANLSLFGLDFMYAKKSGFAIWVNNTFFLGKGSFSRESEGWGHHYGSSSLYDQYDSGLLGGWSGELLLGYSKKIEKHNISVGAGFQAAVGDGFEFILEPGAFAIRVDYSYFFNDKIGITVSITDGLGAGVSGRNPLEFMNSFSLKFGPVFKI
ncbi:DUF2715 domain-containing protein [Treponema denticola]|uniref:DUF2715 domain-containing protein n=1 Tax=Treponema denticola TaxID=158 RepID=UPI0020A5BD6D|nr:DUF2715 domain-containing protein [Treponema denticola]UTD13700.1 DUF2715 domain-containing protein [Treponema denticola]